MSLFDGILPRGFVLNPSGPSTRSDRTSAIAHQSGGEQHGRWRTLPRSKTRWPAFASGIALYFYLPEGLKGAMSAPSRSSSPMLRAQRYPAPKFATAATIWRRMARVARLSGHASRGVSFPLETDALTCTDIYRTLLLEESTMIAAL